MINENREDHPPVVMPPVRRDPNISINGERPGGELRAGDDWTPFDGPRRLRVGAIIAGALAAVVLVLLASVVAHAVWLAIRFGLWR